LFINRASRHSTVQNLTLSTAAVPSPPVTSRMHRLRMGKHVVGHHASSSHTHIPQVGQTFPLKTTPRPPPLNTTNSAPADLSTPISAGASDSVNNESTIDPSVDLETGSNAQLTSRRRFWKRNGKPERQHHELTARAHGKTTLQLFKEILYSSWANLLLVFVPVGIALHFVNVSPTIIFVMNFLAIVPLAGVFSCWWKC